MRGDGRRWAFLPMAVGPKSGNDGGMTGSTQAQGLRNRRPARQQRRRRDHHAREGGQGLDRESQDWLDRLDPRNPEREAGIAALHSLLLKAARFEVNRRRAAFPNSRGDDCEDLAQQSADDALAAVLAKLGDFRGASRFTTWAYKFALLEAASKTRRRAWQEREVPLEAKSWDLIADAGSTPDRDLETKEVFGAVKEAIEGDLTPHQREVLVAVTLNGVPIDVLAERLNTTRGALYKTVHDARRRLRFALAARGLEVDEFMEASSSSA
jgi:RNA polymerase sigma-70 factor (ECF subfamily)